MSQKIICDLGSAFVKIGNSEEEGPQYVVPSIIGTPLISLEAEQRQQLDDKYACIEAIEKRKYLNIYNGIEHGRIRDYEDLDLILESVCKLGFNPNDQNIIITIPLETETKTKTYYLEKFFNENAATYLSFQLQNVASMMSAGYTTGISLEVGDGVTQAVAIVEGSIISSTMEKRDFGGKQVTRHIQHLLSNQGYKVTTSDEEQVVRIIKETYCSVPFGFDPRSESEKHLEYVHRLPDGITLRNNVQEIRLNNDVIYANEIMFNNTEIYQSSVKLQDIVNTVFKKAPIDSRAALASNIVTSGGATLVEKFEDRLYHELCQLNFNNSVSTLSVTAHPDKSSAAWLGCQIMSSLFETSKKQWISMREYYDFGDSILMRKNML